MKWKAEKMAERMIKKSAIKRLFIPSHARCSRHSRSMYIVQQIHIIFNRFTYRYIAALIGERQEKARDLEHVRRAYISKACFLREKELFEKR